MIPYFYSSTELNIPFPSLLSEIPFSFTNPFNATLSVTNDGITFSNSLPFQIYHPPTLKNISPNSGYYYGGQLVTFTGNSFSSVITACLFDEIVMPSTYIDNTSITCTSPRVDNLASSSIVGLQASNGETFLFNQINYFYLQMVFIGDLEPNRSHTNGLIDVLVKIQIDTAGLRIIFGSTDAISLTKVNGGVLAKVPPGTKGVVEVQVLNFNQQIHLNKIFFYYFDYLHLNSSFEPLSGPSSGSTIVRFKTDSVLLPNVDYRCSFGDSLVSGVLVDDHNINCISPKTFPQVVALKLIFDRIYSGTSFNFEFYFEIQPTHLEPNIVPTTGNCDVTLKGSNLLPSTLLRINNKLIVPNTYISKIESKYLSSFMPQEGWSELEASSNGFNFEKVHKPVYFHKPLRNIRVFPKAVPFEVNTGSFLVSGDFISEFSLKLNILGQILDGHTLSSSEIQFKIPFFTQQPANYPALAKFYYGSCSYFIPFPTIVFYFPLSVLDVSPLIIEFSSEQSIEIKSNNIFPEATLSCRFKGVVSQAEQVGVDRFTCKTNKFVIATDSLEISANGLHYQPTGYNLTVFASPQIFLTNKKIYSFQDWFRTCLT